MVVTNHCPCENSETCSLCESSRRGTDFVFPCSSSGSSISSGENENYVSRDSEENSLVVKFLVGAISGGLAAMFTLAGAFTGAVMGALAGRVSQRGVLHGAGIGAVAGASLSIEVLEASRSYWCSDQFQSRRTPSITDFIEELLQGRLLQDQISPARYTSYQLNILEIDEETDGMIEEIPTRGLSRHSLKKLPWQVVTHEKKDKNHSESVCCTICFRDIEPGETVRCLPPCNHIFHVSCVDKWLIRHGSCPLCRHIVVIN